MLDLWGCRFDFRIIFHKDKKPIFENINESSVSESPRWHDACLKGECISMAGILSVLKTTHNGKLDQIKNFGSHPVHGSSLLNSLCYSNYADVDKMDTLDQISVADYILYYNIHGNVMSHHLNPVYTFATIDRVHKIVNHDKELTLCLGQNLTRFCKP